MIEDWFRARLEANRGCRVALSFVGAVLDEREFLLESVGTDYAVLTDAEGASTEVVLPSIASMRRLEDKDDSWRKTT